MPAKTAALECICGADRFERVFEYTAPPEGEVRFQFSTPHNYRRVVSRCVNCGHFLSNHDMDTTAMYTGEYVDSTYGNDGIRRAFDRIASLDPSKSDNVGRVDRIVEFADLLFKGTQPGRSILDVGSGLCVFLKGMKAEGWVGTALDPDTRAVTHARKTVGVNAICGDFMTLTDIGRFDVVTFNKVLEHVQDPITMLRKARNHVNSPGFVYVELPDGEIAVHDGPGREEFFIDHWHVFSAASLTALASRAGFTVAAFERLQEPSSKYTLRCFLVPANKM